MDYSYNDILRKNICKKELSESIIYFESLEGVLKEQTLDIMLLDYYKLKYICNKDYPDLFENSKEEIYKKCYYDTNTLIDILEATNVINNMSFFNKCVVLDEMQYYNQDRNLMLISKLHLIDKIIYQIIDELDSYKEYYIDFKNKNSIDLLNNFTMTLSLRLMSIKDKDINKYKKYILEILKVYYKWKIFIQEHNGEYLLNPEDKAYISAINNYDLEVILLTIEKNIPFLSYILGEYLHYTTSNLEIKEEIVDDYLNKTTNKEIKKKFNIK